MPNLKCKSTFSYSEILSQIKKSVQSSFSLLSLIKKIKNYL